MKTCTRCRAEKPLDDFPPHTTRGHQSYCRACGNTARRASYQRNPNPQRAYGKAYRAAVALLVKKHRSEFDRLLAHERTLTESA